MSHVFLRDASDGRSIWRSLLRWRPVRFFSSGGQVVKIIDPRDIPEDLHHDVGLSDVRSLHPKRYV